MNVVEFNVDQKNEFPIHSRPLMVVTSLLSALCMGSLAVVFALKDLAGVTSQVLDVLPLPILIVYQIVFLVGLGPGPWVLIGELLSGLEEISMDGRLVDYDICLPKT